MRCGEMWKGVSTPAVLAVVFAILLAWALMSLLSLVFHWKNLQTNAKASVARPMQMLLAILSVFSVYCVLRVSDSLLYVVLEDSGTSSSTPTSMPAAVASLVMYELARLVFTSMQWLLAFAWVIVAREKEKAAKASAESTLLDMRRQMVAAGGMQRSKSAAESEAKRQRRIAIVTIGSIVAVSLAMSLAVLGVIGSSEYGPCIFKCSYGFVGPEHSANLLVVPVHLLWGGVCSLLTGGALGVSGLRVVQAIKVEYNSKTDAATRSALPIWRQPYFPVLFFSTSAAVLNCAAGVCRLVLSVSGTDLYQSLYSQPWLDPYGGAWVLQAPIGILFLLLTHQLGVVSSFVLWDDVFWTSFVLHTAGCDAGVTATVADCAHLEPACANGLLRFCGYNDCGDGACCSPRTLATDITDTL